MLSEVLAALAAVVSVQGSNPTRFDETIPDWSVVRRTDGCIASTGTDIGDFTIHYVTNSPGGHSLNLLFVEAGRTVADERVSGYRIVIPGSGGNWNNLNGSSFMDELDGTPAAVVGFAFDTGSILMMLADVSAGREIGLEQRTQRRVTVPLGESRRAMLRLLDCARTVTDEPVPPRTR